MSEMAMTEIKVPLIVQVEGANLEGWTETSTFADISQGRRTFTKNLEPTPQEKVLQLQERVQDLERDLGRRDLELSRVMDRCKDRERELARVHVRLEQAIQAHGDEKFKGCFLVQEIKGIIDGLAG